jgi:hypothetical protein
MLAANGPWSNEGTDGDTEEFGHAHHLLDSGTCRAALTRFSPRTFRDPTSAAVTGRVGVAHQSCIDPSSRRFTGR